MTKRFDYNKPFSLECGAALQRFHLAYTTLGTLNESGDNVVLVFHALTANSNPLEWWPGLVGDGRLFDPARYFIVCANMPGSCYGSLSPLDTDPQTGTPYYHHFPQFTTRDMIRMYQKLAAFLGVQQVCLGIGGSMGGQQLLEWLVESPALFQQAVLLATNAEHSAWGIAFNATQRLCIEADASWKTDSDDAGKEGMKKARAVAMLSYRNYVSYQQMQTGFSPAEAGKNFPVVTKAETYQHYQGEKLAARFTAFSYYFLSRTMDLHNVGRSRGGVEAALKIVMAKTLVINISSDILFPASEQQEIAAFIPDAHYTVIDSLFGHDGFLLETEKIAAAITAAFPSLNKTFSTAF